MERGLPMGSESNATNSLFSYTTWCSEFSLACSAIRGCCVEECTTRPNFNCGVARPHYWLFFLWRDNQKFGKQHM